MKLNEDNFTLFAMKHYSNHGSLSQEEFEKDLKVFTYIKKQIGKDIYNYRLILNHIITMFNVFDHAALHLLFYSIDKENWPDLITYLIFINRMPDYLIDYGIRTSDYKLNQTIIKKLREI